MLGHEQSMELWRRAGSDWRDRGDQSVWAGVNIANDSLAIGECVIALADDHNVRAAIEARGRQRSNASIDLMGTQTFIKWLASDFGIDTALTARDTIERSREGKVPTSDMGDHDGERGDPVYIRIP